MSLTTDPLWARIEWARHAIETVIKEDWRPSHRREFLDLFQALAFEMAALGTREGPYPTKRSVGEYYYNAYIDLRVRRATEILDKVVEIWATQEGSGK